MSTTLIEKGDFVMTRAAIRCDMCREVKRGTCRSGSHGHIKICDGCERECQEAIGRESAPALVQNPKSDDPRSVYSRIVGDWLHTLATILEGQAAALDLLNDDSDAFCRSFNVIGEIRKTAEWLADAKFDIRDPWRLRVAVRDLFKLLDKALLAVSDDGNGMLVPLDGEMRERLKALRTAFEPFKGNL